MIKAEWGTKRQCPKCGTRFYDLQHDDPATCINCGHAWVPEPILKSKQALSFDAAKAESEAKKGEAETDDLDLVDADSDEPSEDAHVDLGGDDDLAEVVVEKDEEDE